MRDPIREAFTRLGDKVLIKLDELRFIAWDRDFWIATLSFIAMVLVMSIEGCMRRGI